MGLELNLKTDLTVHLLAETLKGNSDIKMLREIDSMNYGEGYDFELENLSCRLYSDEGSDDDLIIEIDRYNYATADEQKRILNLLKQLTADI